MFLSCTPLKHPRLFQLRAMVHAVSSAVSPFCRSQLKYHCLRKKLHFLTLPHHQIHSLLHDCVNVLFPTQSALTFFFVLLGFLSDSSYLTFSCIMLKTVISIFFCNFALSNLPISLINIHHINEWMNKWMNEWIAIIWYRYNKHTFPFVWQR